MKKLLLSILFCSFFLISCGGGGSGGTTVTTLYGVVTDVNGTAVEGVAVTLGSASTATGSEGSYTLTANAGSDQVAQFSKSGYVAGSRFVNIYSGVQSYLPLTIMPTATALTLNADTGGTVSGTRNSLLTVGAGVFIDSSGNVVTGNVDVYLTPFDPNTESEVDAFPGDLAGVDTNGDIIPLKSYGIIDVTVMQNGSELQIKEGETVTLKGPASTAGDNPDEMRVWTLDTSTGFWGENTNTATYDEATNTYSTTLTHFSPCNFDMPYDPSCIHGVVMDENGSPIAGAQVTAEGKDSYSGIYSSIQTDSSGGYCMTVERSEAVILTVRTPDGTVTTREITGGSERSTTYPADCSASSCKLVSSIEKGTADPGETTEADCEVTASNNPFSGTCAYNLGSFFECFRPSGACTYDFDMINFNYTIAFANGSYMELGSMQTTGGAANYYGPTGLLCGSMTYNSETNAMTFTTPNGTTVEINTDDSGSMTMTCNGTTTVTLSGSQIDALNNCTGSATNEEVGIACTPAEGSFGYSCTFDSECNSAEGNTCCGRAATENKCMNSFFCTIYDTYSCDDDSDCVSLGDYVCCYSGFFNMCLPLNSCM